MVFTLRTQNDFKFNTTSCGEIAVHFLTVSNVSSLLKISLDKLEAMPSDMFAQEILMLVGRKADQDPDSRLSEEEVKTITQKELCNFSSLFLENNPSIHTEYVETSADTEDKSDTKTYLKNKIISKNENESELEYFKRLVIGNLKHHVAQTDKLFKSINESMKPAILSIQKELGLKSEAINSVIKSITSAQKIQNSLENFRLPEISLAQTEALKSVQKAQDSLKNFGLPKTHFQDKDEIFAEIKHSIPEPVEPLALGDIKNPIHDTNEHLKDVVDTLEKTVPLIGNSANLLTQMNDNTINFADSSARIAKRNFLISITSIVLLTISILVGGVYSIYSASELSKQAIGAQNKLFESLTNEIIESRKQEIHINEKIANSLETMIKNNAETSQTEIEELTNLTNNLSDLYKKQDSMITEIELLQKQNIELTEQPESHVSNTPD